MNFALTLRAVLILLAALALGSIAGAIADAPMLPLIVIVVTVIYLAQDAKRRQAAASKEALIANLAASADKLDE